MIVRHLFFKKTFACFKGIGMNEKKQFKLVVSERGGGLCTDILLFS